MTLTSIGLLLLLHLSQFWYYNNEIIIIVKLWIHVQVNIGFLIMAVVIVYRHLKRPENNAKEDAKK